MRALVAYNKFSGKNKALKKLSYICTQLKTKYEIVEHFKSTGPKSLTEHIKTCGFIYDLIVVIGGDGSVNEVVNGIMNLERKPTVAFIPNGTCNDAATTLGLRKNLKKTMKKILDGSSSKVDIFMINDSYFIYGLAAGCLTEISYDAPHKIKKNVGRFAYYLQGLKSFNSTKPISINLHNSDINISGEYSLFLALNTRYLAGFKLHRKKRIYLDDGNLRVTLIRRTTKIMNIIDFGMFLLFGEAYKHNISHFDLKEFSVDSQDLVGYNTDGEKFGKKKHIDVKVIPQAIDLIISKRVKRRHILNKNK